MSSIVPKAKLSIVDIPVANDRLYAEVARSNKMEKKEVQEIIEHVGRYISDLIKKGTMEGVMLPYFGKFRPKKKQVMNMARIKRAQANGTLPLLKAIKPQRSK
jgi:nucleoid DNA-binding protein